MRRVRIDLAYDGTDFAGWQTQPGLRTVQGVLEGTLSRILGNRPVRVRGAGRTDAGVHACHQVCDFPFPAPTDDAGLLYSLRGMLPGDVRPLSLRTVDERFHSRKDALSKTYSYRLDLSPEGDPFRRRFALHHPQPLDRGAIEEALGLLPGRRDWTGFAAAACEVDDRVRHLTLARFEQASEHEARLTFVADGFLTHMVRNLVGTLLDISRGRLEVEQITRVLESNDRRLAGATAPAHGLFLERVGYPDTPSG